jgi:hypothetical protein
LLHSRLAAVKTGVQFVTVIGACKGVSDEGNPNFNLVLPANIC